MRFHDYSAATLATLAVASILSVAMPHPLGAEVPTTGPTTMPVTRRPITDLQVVIDVVPKAKIYYVGDTVEISAALSNTGKEPIVVLLPDRPVYDSGEPGTIVITNAIRSNDAPPEGGGLGLPGDLPGRPQISFEDVKMASFQQIKPNETTTSIKKHVTLAVPGRMIIGGGYINLGITGPVLRTTGGGIGPDGNELDSVVELEKIPGICEGIAEAKGMAIDVSDEPSPAMKERFDAALQKIDDAQFPLQDRVDALATVAAEKNVLAARFVLDEWRKAPDPAVKLAALQSWLDLLGQGTAYDGLPEAIKLLGDDKTPPDIRGRILDALAKWRIFPGQQGDAAPLCFICLGEQARYTAGHETAKTLKAAVKSAYDSGEPGLVEKAKVLLEKMSPKK